MDQALNNSYVVNDDSSDKQKKEWAQKFIIVVLFGKSGWDNSVQLPSCIVEGLNTEFKSDEEKDEEEIDEEEKDEHKNQRRKTMTCGREGEERDKEEEDTKEEDKEQVDYLKEEQMDQVDSV